MAKKSESGIVLGFILGFTSFYLYGTFSDEKKKTKFLKELNTIKKNSSPYLLELKKRVLSSNELKSAIKELDKSLGTKMYTFLVDYKESKSIEVDEKNTTRSIRKFFGID